MKKILFAILISLCLLPGVNAEEAEWKLFANKTNGTSYTYSAIVDDYLYVFSGYTSSSAYDISRVSHKIELSTGIITDIKNMNSIIVPRGAFIPVGTDIYFFGGWQLSGSDAVYKYDTLTDTYVQLSNLPSSIYDFRAVNIGTDIYLISGKISSSEVTQTIYKYDTTTDTYTTYTPFNSPRGAAQNFVATVGTDIYILGTKYNSTDMSTSYKYDTLTNTLTNVSSLPSAMSGWAISKGTDIYLFPESSTTVYKYDTLTDTYETVKELTRNSARTGNVILYDNKNIYDICGNYENTIYSYSLPNISDEPVNPEEPEEPVIPADTTLDNFYSIYLDKLGSFAQFATENKFVLGTIAIIILFIILEIILNLFRKGGYH